MFPLDWLRSTVMSIKSQTVIKQYVAYVPYGACTKVCNILEFSFTVAITSTAYQLHR